MRWWWLLVLLASNTEAKDVKLTWTYPCFEADSLAPCDASSTRPETSLSHAEIWGRREPQRDVVMLGTVPAVGKECKRDSTVVALTDSVYYVSFWSVMVDKAGNKSCPSNYYLAVSAQEVRNEPDSLGLRALYYDNRDMLAPVFASRVDSTLLHDWNLGAPLLGMGTDTFSIRWVGFLRTNTGGTYTFNATVEDGFRAWIGDVFHDNWGVFDEHVRTWNVQLPPTTYVPLTIEYMANNGTAVFHLRWAPPGAPLQEIPSNVLSH